MDKLLFEHFHCLGGGAVFFSEVTRDIAERSVIDGRAKFGKGHFALRVGIVGTASEQAGFEAHAVFISVLSMIGHLQRLRSVAKDGRVLCKS